MTNHNAPMFLNDGGTKAFSDLSKPGRLDAEGVEWWQCDPPGTWYRWENGDLFTKPQDRAWADTSDGLR